MNFQYKSFRAETVPGAGLCSSSSTAYITCCWKNPCDPKPQKPRTIESETASAGFTCLKNTPQKANKWSKAIYSCFLSIIVHLIVVVSGGGRWQQNKSYLSGTGEKFKHVQHTRAGYLWNFHFSYNSTNQADINLPK